MVDKNKETATAAPATETKTTDALASAVIKSFTGNHFPGSVTRSFTTPDPANAGRNVVSRQRFDLITELHLTRVMGHGTFENTNEPYITLFGQYAPGKTARITVSSQNVEPVAKLLKGNVDKTKKELPLTKEFVVEVVCTQMPGRGFAVQELYLMGNDGSKTAIIGAPVNSSNDAGANNDLF